MKKINIDRKERAELNRQLYELYKNTSVDVVLLSYATRHYFYKFLYKKGISIDNEVKFFQSFDIPDNLYCVRLKVKNPEYDNTDGIGYRKNIE